MKSKIKKAIHLLKLAKERPDWRRKFIYELRHNGLKSTINKMRHKANLAQDTTFSPFIIDKNIPKTELVFPIFEAPLVSVVIPVYNNFDYTYLCLKSILENTPDTAYEIIIADDNSSDQTIDIDRYVKNIVVIRDGINRGFLKNCNKAARYAKGEYLLFLNNDTQVQPNWLSSMITLIQSDTTIGMVGSKLVYPDGKLQEAGGIIWQDASGWNYGHLDDPMKAEYNYVKEADYVSGASLMIQTSLWETIGGFDERYVPAYYEDADLAFEVRKQGFKVVYQPASVVIHFEGVSHGTDTNRGIKRYQLHNQEKFLEKWGNVLQQTHLPNGQNSFLARDRSSTQKTMLFIDHYVPHFDQDAGSRAVLHYLKAFRDQGISIKFIGDNFYHYPETQYVTALEQMGIEVLYGEYYAKNWQKWFLENTSHIDYVIFSRPHITEKYMDFIRTNSTAKLIYFGVDLHYLRLEREYLCTSDKATLKESAFWKKSELSIMKQVDLSCFYSYVEIEAIKAEDPTIQAVNIPLFIYDTFPPVRYAHHERKDIMFVGGFAHTPNVDGIVWFIKEVLPSVREKIPECTLYIIGSNAPASVKELADANSNIVLTGKISDEELERFYASSRLAIAPLRFGAGIKGKVVEALYNGIPMVTTSIGAEGLLNAEYSMLIADEAEQFSDHVIALYQDEILSSTLASRAHEYCKNNFSKNNILEIL